MNAPTTSAPGPSARLLAVGAVALGVAYGFLQETQELGKGAWWVFIAAAVVLGAVGVAMGNRRADSFRPALKALPLLVLTLLGLALGDFLAFLLHIDWRSLDNYSPTMSWQTNLLVTLALAALFGTLLGALASLLSHALRRSLDRHTSG